MFEINLSSRVSDGNLEAFVSHLGNGNGQAEVCINFANLTFIEPGPIVALLAKTHRWLKEGRAVHFKGCEQSGAFQYLQRMDFFRHCGVSLPENFARLPASGRFVEIQELTSSPEVEKTSTALAECIAPELAELSDPAETGFFDCVEYALSELGLNVTQHSQSKGFVMAQFYKHSGQVCLAIADFGIGIKQSFILNGSPLMTAEVSELDAIRKALEAKVSSKTHLVSAWGGPVNAGVGLTLLNALTVGMGGRFRIVSGTGALELGLSEQGIGKVIPEDCRFNGTVCSMSFHRNRVTDFGSMLSGAKTKAGLLTSQARVSELFQ